ncbi:hypothetical protein J4E83_004968 [Alternaria metachromatica]|uniref:uncharacterized protein n=1 Tax=Alternaria metachromatica TaxID=283354 RepID=UPI0020C2D73B|nr:uncharacterized protein J4E83_004968 [Alternaria metachromatica]KAI4622228.1 hypothetical protein J4E83_004968 [Alternaria metachromatica]
MRLLILFLTLLSVAAGFTLQKTDGTVIEVGDEPMVIDGSEVIMPQEMFASASRVKLDGISEATDVSTADINPFPAAVHLYEGPHKQGRRAKAYLCATGMNGCLADGASKPWASSLTLQTCPHGSPVGNKTFACFFFSTPTCDYTSRFLLTRTSIDDLTKSTPRFDETIRSMQCFLDKDAHVAGVDARSERHSDISTADIGTADTRAADVYLLALFEQPDYQGSRSVAYSCHQGDSGCRVIREDNPWASSVILTPCPDGYNNRDRPFTCKLYENSKCQGNPSYSARESIANLATIELDNKIKSVDCYFDTLHGE